MWQTGAKSTNPISLPAPNLARPPTWWMPTSITCNPHPTTMEQRTFNLIDAVCRDGLGNDVWGVADGGNTSDLFGSEANLEINTMFLYVYVDEDAFFPALDRIDADLTIRGEDSTMIRLYYLK